MIYVLMRSRTRFDWLKQSLISVLRQEFNNYKILFIDDASNYTRDQKSEIGSMLKGHVCIFNEERKYSLLNAYELIHKYTNDNDVIVNVDADDLLLSLKTLQRIEYVYKKYNCYLAYGECRLVFPYFTWRSFLPSKYILSGHNIRYPKKVEKTCGFRIDPIFRPLHPRSWRVEVFKKIKKEDFLDNKGKWLRTCEDQAMFFPMLEMVGDKYYVDNEVLYGYRWDYCDNDYKKRPSIQKKEEIIIRKKDKYEKIYG